jgi:hypothetical protein
LNDSAVITICSISIIQLKKDILTQILTKEASIIYITKYLFGAIDLLTHSLATISMSVDGADNMTEASIPFRYQLPANINLFCLVLQICSRMFSMSAESTANYLYPALYPIQAKSLSIPPNAYENPLSLNRESAVMFHATPSNNSRRGSDEDNDKIVGYILDAGSDIVYYRTFTDSLISVKPQRLQQDRTLTNIVTDDGASQIPLPRPSSTPVVTNPNLPTPYSNPSSKSMSAAINKQLLAAALDKASTPTPQSQVSPVPVVDPQPAQAGLPAGKDGAFTPKPPRPPSSVASAIALSTKPPLPPPSVQKGAESPSTDRPPSSSKSQLLASQPISSVNAAQPKMLLSQDSGSPQLPDVMTCDVSEKVMDDSAVDFGLAGLALPTSDSTADLSSVTPVDRANQDSDANKGPKYTIQQLSNTSFLLNFLDKRLAECDRYVPRVKLADAGKRNFF